MRGGLALTGTLRVFGPLYNSRHHRTESREGRNKDTWKLEPCQFRFVASLV